MGHFVGMRIHWADRERSGGDSVLLHGGGMEEIVAGEWLGKILIEVNSRLKRKAANRRGKYAVEGGEVWCREGEPSKEGKSGFDTYFRFLA